MVPTVKSFDATSNNMESQLKTKSGTRRKNVDRKTITMITMITRLIFESEFKFNQNNIVRERTFESELQIETTHVASYVSCAMTTE